MTIMCLCLPLLPECTSWMPSTAVSGRSALLSGRSYIRLVAFYIGGEPLIRLVVFCIGGSTYIQLAALYIGGSTYIQLEAFYIGGTLISDCRLFSNLITRKYSPSSFSFSSVQVRVGLIVTTSRVREDELMATVCASVFSPAVLQRQVLVLASSNSNTAGLLFNY